METRFSPWFPSTVQKFSFYHRAVAALVFLFVSEPLQLFKPRKFCTSLDCSID